MGCQAEKYETNLMCANEASAYKCEIGVANLASYLGSWHGCGITKFKLPKLELRKFGGDPKELLSFWSQFQKIHDDGSIPDEDKMQYLVASVEPKSKAERLILSFPATAANYPKTVDQLKERFGREDLLVQIYVLDLLTMVMKNAVSGRAKTDLSRLYDEL
ncbi:uncharacterized protein TNCV_4851521 [Trichonephila clavipes]|nr:uncharacterized protein TNCV_4851521 [Trichonephila clavipes]